MAQDSLAVSEEISDGVVVLQVDLDSGRDKTRVESFCDLAQARSAHSRGERFCGRTHT